MSGNRLGYYLDVYVRPQCLAHERNFKSAIEIYLYTKETMKERLSLDFNDNYEIKRRSEATARGLVEQYIHTGSITIPTIISGSSPTLDMIIREGVIKND